MKISISETKHDKIYLGTVVVLRVILILSNSFMTKEKQNHIFKNILVHLRLPFSVLLLPVFLLALIQLEEWNGFKVFTLFFILHILVYPSSNGYNSLMDKDEGSIGGIKSPPRVPKQMGVVSFIMDILAIGMMWFYFDYVAVLLLVSYIVASRLYSYRGVRLKQYPITGFLVVTVFQGPVIFALVIWALTHSFDGSWFWSGLLLSYLVIAAGYPLSQIYQHEQDKKDNVETLSMLLGIRGTFVFSGIMFLILFMVLLYHFYSIHNNIVGLSVILVLLAPTSFFFGKWMKDCFKNITYANYDNTMKMNKMGAIAFNLSFLFTLIIKYFIG